MWALLTAALLGASPSDFEGMRPMKDAYAEAERKGVPVVVFVGVQPVAGPWVSITRPLPYEWRKTPGAIVGTRNLWTGDVEGQPTAEGLRALVSPKPVVRQPVIHSNDHSHLCGKCGYEWWHGPENNGSSRAHHCPRCGSGPYYTQHRSHPPAQLMRPQQQSFLNVQQFNTAPRRVMQACPT